MYLLTFHTDTGDYKTIAEDRAEVAEYSRLIAQPDATIVIQHGSPEVHVPTSRIRDMTVLAY